MLEFTLPDMSCGHCASVVTKTVKLLDANARIDIDLETKRVKVESSEPREELSEALTEAGYPPAA